MGRARTPTVLQMEAVECGAACLASILQHYGRYVPLADLRRDCGVNRDGSKASNLLKAARRYGLEAGGKRCEPADLRTLPLPLVVFWNFNHFLIVEGFGRGRVFLNDPASGPRWVTDEEFDASYTGVALTFQPGPDFRREGRAPHLAGALRRRLAGAGSGLVFVVLCALFLVVPGLVVPALVQIFVDRYLVLEDDRWLLPVLLGLGGVGLTQWLLAALQQHYLLRMETRLAMAGASRFLWHVLRLPLEFYSQRYSGEIGTRVALNDRVAALLSGQLATAVLNLTMVVFFAAVMALYAPWLTLFAVGVAVLNLLGLRAVHRLRTDAHQRVLQEEGLLAGQAMRGLQLMESMKGAGTESDFFTRWASLQARVVSARQDMAVYSQWLSVLPVTLAMLNTAAILALGGYRVIRGDMSLGMLIGFQFLTYNFLAPVAGLMDLANDVQEVDGDLKRLDDVLVNEPDPALDAAPTDGPRRLAGGLELRDVTFGYAPLAPPLLEGFSLRVEPGQRVALVGPSGSGKTTVARLVTGLYRPWSGQVLLDGRRREDIPRDVLVSSVATVSQEIFLFEGTVRENLTLWDSTVPDADVVQAARDACVHEDVSGRPGGYRARVEEGGGNFSGGQRQRLEIARALVGNPALLVLDEATSALDPVTEQRIDDQLRRRGCTCLIVAHRLSTIRDCDEILVMDGGRIVERGTHDRLMAEGVLYPRLLEEAEA